MSAEAIIRAQARDTLKNNYFGAVTALLIALLPYCIIDGTTTIISYAFSELISGETLRKALIYSIGYTVEVIGFFLFSPVINGYIRAYYRASQNGILDVSDVYFYFTKGRYQRALTLNLNFILRMLLPAILLFLPPVAFSIIGASIGESFSTSLLFNNCRFILIILSVLATAMYSLRYLTVYTITVDIENISVKQAFDYSRYVMKSGTGSAIKLLLSFIPWMLLCLFILPMLYVIPYMTQAMCTSAKWMTKAAFEVE